MSSIIVNLMSKKKGELKRFLDSYFDEDTQTDKDVMEWIYIYNRPHDAMPIIDTFTDNSHSFDISLWVQIGDEDIVSVNKNNKHMIVEGINTFSKQNKGLKLG